MSTSELKNAMGIGDIRGKELDEEKIIFYLEYIINMLSISNTEYHPAYDIIVHVLYENIEIILSQLNLEKYEVKKCLYRIIPKNAEVCEAFKVVDTSIKRQILEYNHITIRENIAAKRNILLNLYNNFEPKLNELKETTPEGKNIASDLGFLFNNLNIRHNNVEGKNLNNAIKNMSKQEMHEWYDKCYQIYITSVLIHEYSTKHKAAIKKLRQNSQR